MKINTLFKYIGFEGRVLKLIPTKAGLDFVKKFNPLLKAINQKPIALAEGKEKIGDEEIFCFTATMPSDIKHFELQQSYQKNYTTVRVFINGQINYHLQLTLHDIK